MYEKLIQKHEKCIKVLEAIIYFERKKKNIAESLKGYPGVFSELRREYLNDLDTINRCIDRLKQRYKKLIIENSDK